MIYTVKGFDIVNEAKIDFFFWNSLAFYMVQQMLAMFVLCFLCLFYIQLEHLGILGSHTVEAWLRKF